MRVSAHLATRVIHPGAAREVDDDGVARGTVLQAQHGVLGGVHGGVEQTAAQPEYRHVLGTRHRIVVGVVSNEGVGRGVKCHHTVIRPVW
jgi:hypothetical protein